jgi:hypothetical protein
LQAARRLAEAIAAVETAARECEVRDATDRAELLREAATTLRAVIRPDALRRAIQLAVVRYTEPDAAEPATRILCPSASCTAYGGRGLRRIG